MLLIKLIKVKLNLKIHQITATVRFHKSSQNNILDIKNKYNYVIIVKIIFANNMVIIILIYQIAL